MGGLTGKLRKVWEISEEISWSDPDIASKQTAVRLTVTIFFPNMLSPNGRSGCDIEPVATLPHRLAATR
jgi:hypothetical protein